MAITKRKRKKKERGFDEKVEKLECTFGEIQKLCSGYEKQDGNFWGKNNLMYNLTTP